MKILSSQIQLMKNSSKKHNNTINLKNTQLRSYSYCIYQTHCRRHDKGIHSHGFET